jgi:hypothetical protein
VPGGREAPSRFELLFPESGGTDEGGLEPYNDAVAELSDDLRRIVQRVSSRQREGTDA